jgi:hypothetical protein
MATLLYTCLFAESKAVRESKFVNQSYVEVTNTSTHPCATPREAPWMTSSFPHPTAGPWQSYAGSFSTGIRVANKDLVIFAIMGIVGGIAGAGFNSCHVVSKNRACTPSSG